MLVIKLLNSAIFSVLYLKCKVIKYSGQVKKKTTLKIVSCKKAFNNQNADCEHHRWKFSPWAQYFEIRCVKLGPNS